VKSTLQEIENIFKESETENFNTEDKNIYQELKKLLE
jgi:hypothetical protein